MHDDIEIGDLVRHRMFDHHFGDVVGMCNGVVTVYTQQGEHVKWSITNTVFVASKADVVESRTS